MKSSTTYKFKCFNKNIFRFEKNAKLCAINFRYCEKNHFFTRTRIAFSYFIFLSLNMYSLKETKYTGRCSLKSSTIYKEKLILFVYFLCLKNSKICAIGFHNGENWSHRVFFFFLKTKSIHLK